MTRSAVSGASASVDVMTSGSDDRLSGSLRRLYEAVPAAEEIDLREELEVERAWAFFAEQLLDHPDLADLVATPESAEKPGTDDVPHLTMGQAVGMVEHLLGGVVEE